MIPTKIILHHSATRDSGTVSWNAIRRYHINECKWGAIGYHFGTEFIEDKGDPKGSYEILMGRFPNMTGAHTTGLNHTSLGVCFVGNFDKAPVPEEQWRQGVKLVKWLCEHFGILISEIWGHRDFANKTCPGNLFNIEKFKEDVASHE
jgi:hypothetical protein